MKTTRLCLLLCGLLTSAATAQPLIAPPVPPKNGNDAAWNRALQTQRKAQYGSKKAVPESGFFYLLRAAEALDENPAPTPKPEINPTPALQLNYDRAVVAYFQESLRLLRIALQKEVVRPEIAGKPFQTSVENLDDHNYDADFRHLGRILISESNLRLAAGDAGGALDSRLTGMELGVAISRGAPFIGVLTGNSIDAVQRQEFGAVVAKLDAAQLRAGLTRLRALDARRATYAQTWQVEKAVSSAMLFSQFQSLFDPEARKLLITPAGRAQTGLTEAQLDEILALTPEILRQNIDRIYDVASANGELPFQKAKVAPVAAVKTDFLTAQFSNFATQTNYRFPFERQIIQSRLFEAALELRAIKLETGAYPDEFSAPIDPFFFPLQPLIYAKDGAKYQLYSVGLDGKDDGGAPTHTVLTDKVTGIKTVINGLNADSTGDISAPVF